MEKLRLAIITILVVISALSLAPSSYAYYSDSYPSPNEQFHPKNPDYYNGNLRLTLKKRADIERASKPNVHYDKYADDYYSCDWQYNKNLGTWVCNKSNPSYTRSSKAIKTCSYGYTLHPIQQTCTRIGVPANAHLVSGGNAWACDSGYHMNNAKSGCARNSSARSSATASAYASASAANVKTINYISQSESVMITKYVYVYGDNESETPSKIITTNYPSNLPSTGTGLEWVFFAGSLGTYRFFRRKK